MPLITLNQLKTTLQVIQKTLGLKADKSDLSLKADKSDLKQPDWEQNDSIAADYIKNKPFSSIYGQSTISYYDETTGYEKVTKLVEGETYTVKIGDQVFENLICYKYYWYQHGGKDKLLLGGTDGTNTSTWTNGFLIYSEVITDGTKLENTQIYAFSTDGSFGFTQYSSPYSYGKQLTESDNVQILGMSEIITKIDAKYIPTTYATCSTSEAAINKVATTISQNFLLQTGARVTVKFSNYNIAHSPTLNVDSTGAKSIYWHGSELTSAQFWEAGAVLDFVYNGTQYELVGVAKDNGTNYNTGTDTISGLTKLYTETGSNTDGTMTQDAITNAIDASLPKSGGTMTGSLILSADPTDNLEAATKQYVDNHSSGASGIQSVWYGTCTTAAATAAKEVTTTTGNFTLIEGATVYVLFNTAHTSASRITLNVDGTGDIAVNSSSTNGMTAYQIAAKQVICFVYDGESFRVQGGSLATTQYYGLTKLSSSTSSTSTTLAATPSAVKAAYDLAAAALPKSGGTMTGTLTLASNPTNDLEAATKQYVDSAITTSITDAIAASY